MFIVEEVTSMQHAEDIIPLARANHAERCSRLPFVPDCIREAARRLIIDDDRPHFNAWVLYTIRDENTRIPIGFFVGTCTRFFFNYNYCASQELWYVRPDYRGTKAPFALLKAFEEWARLRGAVRIFTGVVAEKEDFIAKFSRMMERIGYPKMGLFFRKETI